MPAAATHIEFGKDFLDAIPKKMRQQITNVIKLSKIKNLEL